MGPFVLRLKADLPDLAQVLRRMYAYYPLCPDQAFADFHVSLCRPRSPRRWYRPQARFYLDGHAPFSPFDAQSALPFLEWGLNWSIATRGNHLLMLHAGAVEKHGVAVILPANPGSGKSTLCAALCHRGWRLLSDEFALVRPSDTRLLPIPRLIALKNNSIPVIRDFAPDAVLGPVYPKTRKGDVAHVRPPRDSVEQAGRPARAGFIVFPQWTEGRALELRPLPKERAFLKMSGNSFNYEFIGLRGFETAAALIDTCDCYLLNYGSLEQAVGQLERLVEAHRAPADAAGGEPH